MDNINLLIAYLEAVIVIVIVLVSFRKYLLYNRGFFIGELWKKIINLSAI